MRAILCLILPCALAACMEATPPPDDLRQRQETACANAIAAHVNRPTAEVRPRWLSEAGGLATVETWDGGRRHLCTVDGSARVTGYSHPPA
ncbi:hypothetical protein [Paracoccus xiamenensis]|uniref:hypothetical protein n=1 Tax=Paracoccus xiamenensis TaxID=2714901 RepID=UPI001408A376|nr:hypothetical protein [Paracoccus xiamenensis]NHF74068.1 hypothetical protein [Paracoccus xiamenensis]